MVLLLIVGAAGWNALYPQPTPVAILPLAASPSPSPAHTLTPTSPPVFDGELAYRLIQEQLAFGPRTPGSDAHRLFQEWADDRLESSGWEVVRQSLQYSGHPIVNLIATRSPTAGKQDLVLGAHYDSRFFADRDPDPANQTLPVPGASDGASGVAVLLELARTLPSDLPVNLSIVLFDAEDQGSIAGWDWILGSRAYVESLQTLPDYAVIVDMVGDSDLNLYYERNSDSGLSTSIWAQAAALGYAQFIPEPKHAIFDDHTPFLQAGVRAVDLIDFDYPYWHTVQDTAENVSASSLHAVGSTLFHWLQDPQNFPVAP